MPLSRRSLLTRLSGVVLGSLSASAYSQSVDAVANTPDAAASAFRSPRIALLMPPDNSPFLAAARIVANGLTAANKTSHNPAEVFLIESAEHTSIRSALDAAVLSGADIAVGPIERSAVEALAALDTLPLPVLALNSPKTLNACPDNLAFISISTEDEAEWISTLALEALPSSAVLNKIAVIVGSAPWEARIKDVYERVLQHAGVDYEIVHFDPEQLDDLQKHFEPQLSAEDSAQFDAALRKALAAAQTPHARSLANRSIYAQKRARVAESDPPFQAALFALSAQEAALLRNRLPQKTRVWATSTCNPGDTNASSTATTLAYDLNSLVFCECPAILRYDAASFEEHFGTPIPFSLAAKRLFALGADACSVALELAQQKREIRLSGETGELVFNKASSPVVVRTPQAVAVSSGKLVPISRSVAAQRVLPTNIEPPASTENPDTTNSNAEKSDETLHAVEPEDVKSIVIDDNGPQASTHTPMIHPAADEPAALP